MHPSNPIRFCLSARQGVSKDASDLPRCQRDLFLFVSVFLAKKKRDMPFALGSKGFGSCQERLREVCHGQLSRKSTLLRDVGPLSEARKVRL
ncbi:hypothetical protein NPIL_187521 [Nephila pilipes]|uniref:Uncharacterized protein n=1 Tax=Nephila pilipes TaxID=299642 RepID=A0A8X6TF32_NEPPI|nr:hypothetical protein NPIL_187521 [Nephila pilipes]